MLELCIGSRDGDRVIVQVLSGSTPEDEYGWLSCELSVVAGAFSGAFPLVLASPGFHFPIFRGQLQRLHDSLEGTAEFETLERHLKLKCTGDGLGHIVVDGEVQERAGSGNRLVFRIEIDQTFLPAMLRELEAIERAYPGAFL